ncbi:MAG TPA: ParB/RepB/Spo0J family partition protein [Anaerolineaceae bacterium]
MTRKGGLGKGLGALIPEKSLDSGSVQITGPTQLSTQGGDVYIPITQIVANPRQPRSQFSQDELNGLADSIREHGVLQPVIVSHDPGTNMYILIAGERRMRAAQIAGLTEIPAIIRQVSEQQRLEMALIENIQRSDLTPLETAEAYRQLGEEFGLSHEVIARKVGKNRVTITNTLRLLKLSPEVHKALADGKISEGHARALLGLNTASAQSAALNTILKHDLNVRQTEDLVKKMSGERPRHTATSKPSAEIQEIENTLRQHLGTRVSLHHGKKGGTVTIFFYSDEELNSLVSQLIRD